MLFPTTVFAIFFLIVYTGHWLLRGRSIFWKPFLLAAQKNVLVFGDSLMKLVSRSIEKDMDRDSNMDATSIVSIGSGLARLDLFDWNAKIENAVSKINPSIAVAMIGANDNQPMKTDSGIVRLGTDAWKSEYRKGADMLADVVLERIRK